VAFTFAAWNTLFHYAPKHASWLNQVEIWLGILTRKVVKRGSFTSVQDLQEKIFSFIQYYNKQWARPFKWAYQGKPLQAGATKETQPSCTRQTSSLCQGIAFEYPQGALDPPSGHHFAKPASAKGAAVAGVQSPR
jgi:hypothetical protein